MRFRNESDIHNHQIRNFFSGALLPWRPLGVALLIFFTLGCDGRQIKDGKKVFVPAEFEPPVLLELSQFRLRPIYEADAQLDFEAVVSSADSLREQFGDAWPTDDFSVQQNQAELAIHERQFANREAFVYTVLLPDESKVLGCVYIFPDESQLSDAIVQYWVRKSEMAGDLPKLLRGSLESWLRNKWPFERVQFDGPQ